MFVRAHWFLGCLMAIASTTLQGAESRSVSVDGHGQIEVAPDMVTVSLTLKAVDDDLVRVRANSDKQLRGMMEMAAKHGVADGDFTVSDLKMSLSFNEELKRHIFHVERTTQVTLKKLAGLNPLLAELLKQPDMTIGDITFNSSQAEQLAKQARQKAIAHAKAMAGDLADATGVKLGKPLSARFESNSQRPFVTSVLPVVGQRGRAPQVPLSPATGGFFIVAAGALQAPPANDAAFGVGVVTFSAAVAIEFELLAE